MGRHRGEPLIPGWAFVVVASLMVAFAVAYASGMWHP